MQHYAAVNNIIVVVPDTPVPVESMSQRCWTATIRGRGAGFYLNATNIRGTGITGCNDYILHELPDVVMEHLPVTSRKSISGHSMGLGALVLLRNPDEYVSIGIFH